MFDFIGDLFSAGAGLIGGIVGGVTDLATGLFGGGAGSSGSGIFGLGLDIFGGGGGGTGGLFNSPIFGHVLGAVGTQLMQPTAEERAEEMAAITRAQEDERRKAIRKNYGLPETASPNGRGYGGLYTPRRTAETYL